MADNVTLNSGSGGSTLATDDVTDAGGAHYQRVKLTDGTANSTTHIHAGGGVEANALRVTIASDSTGVVSVDDNGSTLSVDDGGASLTVDGTVTANLSATDNAVLDSIDTKTSFGSVTGGGVEASALRVTLASDSTGTLTVDDGGSTISVDDGGGALTVDGTVTANLSATDNAVLDQIDSNTDFGAVTGGGTETGALRVTIANDSTGVVSIDDNGSTVSIDDGGGNISIDDGGNSITVDNGGTFAVQSASAGDVAHDTADSGNPVKIGAKATNSVEGLTQVANNDRTDLRADLNGVLITRPHTTLEEIITERVSDTTGTSTNFTNFAAGGAGVHNYVTTITVYNSSATDGYVDIRDGSAGSVLFTVPAPATGGSVINLPVPLKGAANTALAYDVSGALSTVYISMVGYQAQG